MMFMMKYFLCSLALLSLATGYAVCQEPAVRDQAYIKKFLEKKPKIDPPAILEDYATRARYDQLVDGLDKSLVNVSNDKGGIAWWLSYWMMSLNEMYRATNDAKYLAANLKCIKAILAVTDDKIGKKLYTGRVVKAWGCDAYAEKGRALYAVHTGVITAPMLEFLVLAKTDADFSATLGDDAKVILDGATAALAEHDRQWREGPEPGAGHYIGMEQEPSCEGKPLPGNRLSAMGWALWASWKLTGNTIHRDHAIEIGKYIKDRLTPAPDGATYWKYWLPVEPVGNSQTEREKISGEDSSHASLTFALPLALARDGQVFSNEDMQRIGKMVINGLGRFSAGNPGILSGDITGSPSSSPDNISNPARWLALVPYEPHVKDIIIPYYLSYDKNPSPLELAQLILFQKGK
jgi:hypothetical protein